MRFDTPDALIAAMLDAWDNALFSGQGRGTQAAATLYEVIEAFAWVAHETRPHCSFASHVSHIHVCRPISDCCWAAVMTSYFNTQGEFPYGPGTRYCLPPAEVVHLPRCAPLPMPCLRLDDRLLRAVLSYL